MTIFRYSARAGTHDRGALFPFVLAGCLGLWALIAMAIASGPKLAAMDVESGGEAAYVSCQPAAPHPLPAAVQLFRCTVSPGLNAGKEI